MLSIFWSKLQGFLRCSLVEFSIRESNSWWILAFVLKLLLTFNIKQILLLFQFSAPKTPECHPSNFTGTYQVICSRKKTSRLKFHVFFLPLALLGDWWASALSPFPRQVGLARRRVHVEQFCHRRRDAGIIFSHQTARASLTRGCRWRWAVGGRKGVLVG